MRIRLFLIFIAIAVLTVALAAVVMARQDSFVYDKIVRPLSYAFWLGSIMVSGTPQAIFWGILVLNVFVMTLRSLFGSSRKSARPQIAPSGMYQRSRLRYWLHQLQLNRYEAARFQLYDAVARLSMDVLAYQEGTTLQQYMRQVDPENIQPEILAPYLQARSQPIGRLSSWDLQELRRTVTRLWKALPFRKDQDSTQNPDLERVVAYLEEQMDVDR